jgi:hypothetical protein
LSYCLKYSSIYLPEKQIFLFSVTEISSRVAYMFGPFCCPLFLKLLHFHCILPHYRFWLETFLFTPKGIFKDNFSYITSLKISHNFKQTSANWLHKFWNIWKINDLVTISQFFICALWIMCKISNNMKNYALIFVFLCCHGANAGPQLCKQHVIPWATSQNLNYAFQVT